MAGRADGHPVRVEVEYPDRPLNRLTTFFRVFTIIPIAIVLATVSGTGNDFGDRGTGTTIVVAGGGALFAAPLLRRPRAGPRGPWFPAVGCRVRSR